MRSQFEKLAFVFDLKRIKVDHQFTPLVIDRQVAKAIENLEGIIIIALQSKKQKHQFLELILRSFHF